MSVNIQCVFDVAMYTELKVKPPPRLKSHHYTTVLKHGKKPSFAMIGQHMFPNEVFSLFRENIDIYRGPENQIMKMCIFSMMLQMKKETVDHQYGIKILNQS